MTITKERLEQYAFDDRMCNINDEIREMARMALAGMEAEPGEYLTHVVDDGCGEFSDRMNFSLPVGTKLYSAPHPLTTSERAELENNRNAQQVVTEQINSITAVEPDWSDPTNREPGIWAYGWNECRAAMLNGQPAERAHLFEVRPIDCGSNPSAVCEAVCKFCGASPSPVSAINQK